MKLKTDFGVRALLSVIGAFGFYVIVLIVLFKVTLDVAQIVAIVSMAQAPWMLAIGYYFGTRAGQGNTNPPAPPPAAPPDTAGK